MRHGYGMGRGDMRHGYNKTLKNKILKHICMMGWLSQYLLSYLKAHLSYILKQLINDSLLFKLNVYKPQAEIKQTDKNKQQY